MKKTQKWLGLIIPVVIAAGLIFAVNFAAVKYCMENINVFAAMTLIVPVVIVAAAAFAEGVQIKWNWKKGLCIALVLTLVSFGIERMVVKISGNQLPDLISGVTASSGQPSDELMAEIYDELDKKAYEYMLEQGLISEGDEILHSAGPSGRRCGGQRPLGGGNGRLKMSHEIREISQMAWV